MTVSFDAIIVGAGISGLATAYELGKRGSRVAIVERFAPAAMASGWTLAGVRQSGRHPAELPLAKAAVSRWQRLDEELGGPTRYTRRGNIRLARTEAEYGVIRQLVVDQAAAGLDITFLPTNEALRDIAPAVGSNVLAASYCASDGHADPDAVAAAFLGAAQRTGATVKSGVQVLSIEVASGRVVGVTTSEGRIAAPRVVIAAGVFGNDLLDPLGLRVPLAVQMVTVIRTAPMSPMLDPVIGVANGDFAARQEVNGRFRITSGAYDWHGSYEVEQRGDAARPVVRPSLGSIARVVDKATQLLPAIAQAPADATWAGLIDLTPDALPVLDAPASVEGLVIGMGFSGHGFCLGPITGEILADLVLGDRPRFALDAFRQDRFSGHSAAAPRSLTLHG